MRSTSKRALGKEANGRREPRAYLEQIAAHEREIQEAKAAVSRLEAKISTLHESRREREAEGDYAVLIRASTDLADIALPIDSTVIVISKGDNRFLDLRGRQGWHFPQTRWGAYAGCYPADGVEAVSHLEELRNRGGEFLLIPSTAFWWLEYYQEFKQHLDRHYRLVAYLDDVCLIFALRTAPAEAHE